MKAPLACALIVLANGAQAAACERVDQHLTETEKASWEPRIARQTGVAKLSIERSFHVLDWRVLEVKSPDSVLLIYRGDPRSGRLITQWKGPARGNEQAMQSWASDNAHAMPARLAACFGWLAVQSR